MKKQLIVDYTKKDASLKVLPSKPLLLTNNKNLQFEYHRLSANEVPEHLPLQHTIVIVHDPSKRVHRRMGGKLNVEFPRSGDIVISPANVPHHVYWDTETSFSGLFLNPKCIAEAAHEFINPDRAELLPHFTRPDPLIYGVGQMLKSRLESGLPTSQTYIEQLVSFLAIHLLENYCSIEHKLPENKYSFSSAELKQVLCYFDSHIDRQISLAEISKLLDMSQYHFARLFKQAVGTSPAQYLLTRRLEKTAQLLRSTNLDLGAIARRTGFSSPNHLCTAFKERFLVTPHKYRNSV